MKVVIVIAVALVASAPCFGAGVAIPWEEFKALYRESVERQILEQTAAPKKDPMIYSIDEARYVLKVGGDLAQGQVLLSGKVVTGPPVPIPLFGKEAIITEITRVAGGSVLATETNGMSFLPNGTAPEFQLVASFLVRPGEDAESRLISFGIPPSLQNSLELTLPPETRLLDEPGIADGNGTYHFSACPRLTVRYVDKQGLAAAAALEIDSVSCITVRKNRIFITTYFLPIRAVAAPLILQAPAGARYISSSLKASWVRGLEENRYAIEVPASEKRVFSIEWALDALTDNGKVSFRFPVIEGNSGQQGRFVIEEPDDAQVTVTAEGLVAKLPIERLGDVLCKHVEKSQSYMAIPANEKISLTLERFQSVRTPTSVLDSQCLFSSFEENGNVLSILILDVTPDVGARLKLKAVPDAEIWSLTVNNAKKKVYAGEQDTWVVPLESGQASHVELAFLRKGPKLGLQGRLEAIVPESGLPSREVRIGVALPARVELLSIEGPVSAAEGETWKLPAEFVGKPYFFSRSFHKGDGMKLAVWYKEPVERFQNEKGNAK
ncbi:MAG TPA: hypothetical protein HPP77_01575 [Candidatus Hydrogenedentes bacterium]|nr:hypothetical protein [Candidatus Hydrogenedentota bacterium]